jgi:hypothetical protein
MMANPIYQPPIGSLGESLIHGSDSLSPIDPATGDWRTANAMHFLRAIYFELRIQTQLLADGLGVNAQLASYRADASSVWPGTSDQD